MHEEPPQSHASRPTRPAWRTQRVTRRCLDVNVAVTVVHTERTACAPKQGKPEEHRSNVASEYCPLTDRSSYYQTRQGLSICQLLQVEAPVGDQVQAVAH